MNIFILVRPIFQATEGITDEYWTVGRMSRINEFNSKGRGLGNYGNWVCLDSYDLLGKKFGWSTYTEVQKKYFEVDGLKTVSGDARLFHIISLVVVAVVSNF